MPTCKPALTCTLLLCLSATAGCQWLHETSLLPSWLSEHDTTRTEDPAIAHLHEQASLALLKDRLTVPAHDNAVLYYQKILALDPDNANAHKGLAAVVDRYCSLARTAHNNGETGKARKYLQRAEAISGPSDKIRAVAAELQKPAGQQPRDLARGARKRYTTQRNIAPNQAIPAAGRPPSSMD